MFINILLRQLNVDIDFSNEKFKKIGVLFLL